MQKPLSHDYESDDDYSNFSFWNTSNSDWCEPGEHESTVMTFQACVFCLLFLLGTVGNGLVIATFLLYRRHHLRSMTDVFLVHLALADLLLLLSLPLQAVETNLGWIFSTALCKATRACYAVNTYSGLLLLACVSVDRYVVVARAQHMLRLRGRLLSCGTLAAAGVWLAAALLSLPEILFAGVSVSGDDAYCGMQLRGRAKMATNAAIITVFCLSFVVMLTCYSLVGRVLCQGGAHRPGKQWRRQRTLRLMVALVVAFLLFQLPYTVVLSRKMAGQFCGPLLEYVTCTLAYARCCLNPVLYTMVGVHYRKDVLRLLRDSSCLCGHPSTGSSASTSLSSPAACSPASPDSTNEVALSAFFSRRQLKFL